MGKNERWHRVMIVGSVFNTTYKTNQRMEQAVYEQHAKEMKE
jgi:hypothetical protein